MRSLLTTIQIVAVLGALGGVALFVKDYTETKNANENLRAGQDFNNAVVMTLGMRVRESQERAAHYRNLHEELRDVEDDNSCRSPAIDHAYDVLRRSLAED